MAEEQDNGIDKEEGTPHFTRPTKRKINDLSYFNRKPDVEMKGNLTFGVIGKEPFVGDRSVVTALWNLGYDHKIKILIYLED